MPDDFDPKKYLAEKTGGASTADDFDPAKYLAEKTAQPNGARLVTPEEAYPDKGAAHSATFGALDWYPGGKQLAALGTALRLKLAGNPMGFGENYHQALGQFDREDKAALAHQSLAHAAGAVPAFALSAAALPGGPATQGALYGVLGSGADDALAQGDYGGATLRAVSGLGGGALAGKGLQLFTKAAAPVLGRAAEGAGNKIRDLAGWLKVNSIHPTPTLAEAMEDVPGGVPAVGRVLLQQGVGGLTKSGTAKQIEAAFSNATGKASELANAFDATGGHVDLGQALNAAEERALKLMDEPATREAGQKLLGLLSKYADKYGAGDAAPAAASDALATKRALGKIAYGAKAEFKLNKNPVVGDYGKGVSLLERGADNALDNALGPDFESANTLVRQLGGAKQAAERAAARTNGNTILGLLPYLAGLAGGVGGHAAGQATPEAIMYGLGTLLAGKYGAQAGARALYSPVGGSLGLLARGLQAVPSAMERGVVGVSPMVGRIADLLRARQRAAPAQGAQP